MTRSGPIAALFGAVALCAPAWADPEDALDPLARSMYVRAREREEAGSADEAAAGYRAVVRLDPSFTQATVDLGRVLLAASDLAGAEAALQAAPYDADAVAALGALYLSTGRSVDAAAMFLRLRDLRPESPWSAVYGLSLSSVPDDPDAATVTFLSALSYEGVAWDDELRTATEAMVSALSASGRPDLASRLVDGVARQLPDAAQDRVIAARLDRARVEDQARRMREAVADGPTGAQRTELEGVRQAFGRGAVDEARARVQRLMVTAPRCAEVWGVAADIYERTGQVERAEAALLRARALDPLSAQYPARLGDLLFQWYGGRFDRDAADAWREAALLAPGDVSLRAKLARAERSAVPMRFPVARDDWRGETKVFDAIDAEGDGLIVETEWASMVGESGASPCATWASVAADPRAGMFHAEARRMLDGCRRRRAEIPKVERRTTPVDPTVEHLWITRALRMLGRREDAEAELRVVLEADRNSVDALVLSATLAADPPSPNDERARAALERALALDPARVDAMVMLGEIEERSAHPDAALAWWRRAADGGSADGYYGLAKYASEQHQPWEALRWLDALDAQATSGATWERARTLRADVEKQIRWWEGGAATALGASLASVVGLVAWVRRRRGASIAELLARDPASGREVARWLASIRHEVLKHDAPLLPLVADAIDRGDVATTVWAAQRLFGDQGVVARCQERVGALERLAGARGVPLDLRGRDPVVGPILTAIERLQSMSAAIRTGRASTDELRALGRVLAVDGYQRIGELIRSLSWLRVDASALETRYAQVAGEPAFVGRAVAPLDVEIVGAATVRLYPGDFDDVVVNLLRNALAATLEQGHGRVGVKVELESDPITGVERVSMRFRDDAPRRLSTAVLRSRYVERGLGLTVDIISRNAGSISVEAEPGWSKSVVVRLPVAEAG
jgi:tetratricopeptide (TPR) repeat protein